MQKRLPYSRETAEMLAVQALAFIAEDDVRLSGFIASTGIAVQSIRDAAREPDHLLSAPALTRPKRAERARRSARYGSAICPKGPP